jgi:hypothetical protein
LFMYIIEGLEATLEKSCWKKGDFFHLISTLFCEVKTGFVDPWKLFLWSRLPCLGWRLANFYTRCFSQKKVCSSGASILVLVLSLHT